MINNNEMNKKNKAFQKKSQLLAGGLMILVIAGIFFLSTDQGKRLLGTKVNPYASRANLGKFRQVEKPIKDQYLVVLKDGIDADSEAARLAGRYNSHAKNVYHDAINGFSAKLTESQAKAISQDENVQWVEEDEQIETQTTQTNAPWGIARVDNHGGFVYPMDTNYDYVATGQGVNAYIIDTGVHTENYEFGGRASQPFDATHDWDPSDAAQCNVHGTSVASVVGSNTYGIAKQVKIYSIKIFPCQGVGSASDVVNGIDYVTKHAVKPAVANMSFGGSFNSTINQAVQSLINKGVTAVVAAGNWGDNACNYSPSSVTGALVVGMTDERDYKSDISNYGNCVDLYAPGAAIPAVYGRDGIESWLISGTSLSSPHAAGAAALYLQVHPSALPDEVQSAVVTNATAGAVIGGTNVIPNFFLSTMFDATPPPPGTYDITPPTVSISSPKNGSTVRNKDVNVKVSANDASGISQIVISLDGNILKTCLSITSCSATITASTLPVGSHTITATATDNATTPNSNSTSITINK